MTESETRLAVSESHAIRCFFEQIGHGERCLLHERMGLTPWYSVDYNSVDYGKEQIIKVFVHHGRADGGRLVCADQAEQCRCAVVNDWMGERGGSHNAMVQNNPGAAAVRLSAGGADVAGSRSRGISKWRC